MSTYKNAFPCIICPEHFATKPEQADHLAKRHSFDQPWLCHQCSESFEDVDALNDHSATSHPHSGSVANKHQCSLHACGLHFASEKLAIRHKQQDHTQQAARMGKGLKRGCTQRDCQYTNESCVAYSVHMLHLHQPKCAACDEKFEEFAGLQKHRNDQGGVCVRKTLEPSGSSSMASSSGAIGNTRSENDHVSPAPSQKNSTPNRLLVDGASVRTMAEPNGSSIVASSSGTIGNMRSENGHFGPAPSHTEVVPPWVPTDGIYGSLLDDSPAAVSYDRLQHRLVNWAPGDWARPTDLAPAPPVPEWQPVADDVVSPFPPPRTVPSLQPMAQQRQSQYDGEPTFVADPPLPQSVLDRGYTDHDFDPSIVWDPRQVDKIGHRDYPSDLQDIHIFNGDPHLIRYGNILRLSTKYTNVQIYERSNKNREHPAFISKAAIDSRITAAIKWAAGEWNMPGGCDDVIAWLDGERVKNGLRPRQKKRKREADKHSHTIEGNLGERVYAMPSKRINTTETTLNPQQQQPFSHPMQFPSTPVQQTAGLLQYSTFPTPATTPSSTATVVWKAVVGAAQQTGWPTPPRTAPGSPPIVIDLTED